jgi:hypothetical protein
MNYRFTKKIDRMICRNCGKKIDEKWSIGGVGATCMECSDFVDNLDLVEIGLVRNVVKIPSQHTGAGYTFAFEVKIDDKWYKCCDPCGNWSYVDLGHNDYFLTVPVGWFELNELFIKHFNPNQE